ncbi:AMP-binding enzyme family protein [Burkholderia thailandensis MSMB121]|uniref:long-chain fatty acid--CoA ligase n=1 Tax=Burkholderia humptydooensis TaxID=430531 RepID=UPI000327F543|nr:long-chain fatty acid--CoA ligase [Burkholderia humptydooensis]AGK46763.1 AMP-binding enzyme family protein [Burkholderia thailandensis MSMB121]ATF35258.1 long-chain fatty acid--CoA ligase [Burkholderia thailandensis]KST75829.1 long-chain fatty acid--CoA ligase [Burkholderia humptydooensis]
MFGLMQDKQLLISDLLEYARVYHGAREIVSQDAAGAIHRYTYADAAARAAQLAHALDAHGVADGDRVASIAMNGYRHFEMYYGVSGIGAVLHTVNPRLFDAHLVYVINHAEDRLLFVDPEFLPTVERIAGQLPCVEKIVVLGDAGSAGAVRLPVDVTDYETFIGAFATTFAWPSFDERKASSLCYTSGTTGEPKGVLYSHRSTVVHALAAAQQSAFGIASSDVVMPIAPMFHANAWAMPYLAAMTGAKLVLPGRRLDGESVQRLVEREQVTFTVAVPTVVTMLLEHLRRTGSRIDSLRRAVVGGSAVPPPMIRTLKEVYGCQVHQVWGMTELSPLGTFSTLSHAASQLDDDAQTRIMACQGRAQFGMELKLVGEDGRRLAHDGRSVGAIWVRSAWAASGYFKQASGGVLDGDGWFPTGDVGTIDPLGYLRITDRAKDVIKSGGEWISSVDLESLCYGHPAVKLAAVVGASHPKWEERPVLCIVRKADEPVTKDELLTFLSSRVAKWWLPDDVVFLDEMPLTPTGKIRKTELRDRFRDHLTAGARRGSGDET